MDDFLDNILIPSSWQDMNATGRSTWMSGSTAQTNGLLADPVGAYEGTEKNSQINITPSGHIIGNLVSQGPTRLVPADTSGLSLIGGNSSYGLMKGLFSGEAQPQQEAPGNLLVPPGLDGDSHEGKLSLEGLVETSARNGSLGVKLNTSSQLPLPHGSSELHSAKSSSALGGSSSVGGSNSEPSGFHHSLEDSHSISSLWPASYNSVSSLTSVLRPGKLQGFGLQGDFVESDAKILENKLAQLDSLPAPSEQDEMHPPGLPSFTSEPPMTLRRASGLQSQQQLSQSAEANSIKHYANNSFSQLQPAPAPAPAGGCNGTVKPRVRARRGQATDPHSIAERLRREKIAERMKNLQELVPNSNKTDKASMLDEIIEYVKFLQLQVKVLSMSRLGAAGAVVPLITDVQTEGSNSLLLSASQGADLSESPDNLAFEQEVVKLMESNVTTAMQYLQTKGLCLMPIALAAAISSGKASANSTCSDRKNPGMTNGLVSPNGGSPSAASQPLSSGNDSMMRENMTRNNNIEEVTASGCNGAVVKQEELEKSASSMRELKPKA